jgi:hypothetical protein
MPIANIWPVWRYTLPQERVTQRSQAKSGEAIEIIDTLLVAAQNSLIAKHIADAANGTLVSAPQFKPLHRTPRKLR